MDEAKTPGPSGSPKRSLSRRQLLKGLGLTAVGAGRLPVALPAGFAAAGGDTIKIVQSILSRAAWRCWGGELARAEVARHLQNKKAASWASRSSLSGATRPTPTLPSRRPTA